MKLYYFPGSCALAPHIVLEWLDIDFEAVRIEKGDPDYLQINPLGVVPALERNGKIYTQADAILHYLSTTHPEADLGDQGSPEDSYELHHWMAFLTGDLHPAFYPFFGPQRFSIIEGNDQQAAVKAASQHRVAGFYAHLDTHLHDRQFLVGRKRSIADAYAIPMLRWGRLLDKPLSEYANLDAYLRHWENDEGVQRALSEQGLAE